MNMKQIVLSVVTTTAMTAALPSFADRHHDDDGYSRGGRYQDVVRDKGVRKSDSRFERYLERRQGRQLRRVADGVDTGELTRKEARKLKRQQHRIARVNENFSADGHYSRKERRILEAKLDEASEKIRQKKHNDKVRKENYYAGLWKPNHGFDGGFRKGGYLERTVYPGQGFFFWW